MHKYQEFFVNCSSLSSKHVACTMGVIMTTTAAENRRFKFAQWLLREIVADVLGNIMQLEVKFMYNGDSRGNAEQSRSSPPTTNFSGNPLSNFGV